MLVGALALTVLGLLAWPTGLWLFLYERFHWYPVDQASLVGVLVLILGIWFAAAPRHSRRRLAAAIALLLAFGATVLANVLEYTMGIHPGVLTGDPPPADPVRWGHPTAAMSVELAAQHSGTDPASGVVGRVISGALLATALITSIGILALTTYAVGVPLLPGVTAVVGPGVGLAALMLSVASATNEPDLPPMTWLANRSAAITLVVVGLNLLFWLLLFRALTFLFESLGVKASLDLHAGHLHCDCAAGSPARRAVAFRPRPLGTDHGVRG